MNRKFFFAQFYHGLYLIPDDLRSEWEKFSSFEQSSVDFSEYLVKHSLESYTFENPAIPFKELIRS